MASASANASEIRTESAYGAKRTRHDLWIGGRKVANVGPSGVGRLCGWNGESRRVIFLSERRMRLQRREICGDGEAILNEAFRGLGDDWIGCPCRDARGVSENDGRGVCRVLLVRFCGFSLKRSCGLLCRAMIQPLG